MNSACLSFLNCQETSTESGGSPPNCVKMDGDISSCNGSDQHTGLTIWNEYGRDSLLLDDSTTPNSWAYMTAPPFGCAPSNSMLGMDPQFSRSPHSNSDLAAKFNDSRGPFQDHFSLQSTHYLTMDPSSSSSSSKLAGNEQASYLDIYDASGKLADPQVASAGDLDNPLGHDLYHQMLFPTLNESQSDFHKTQQSTSGAEGLEQSLQGLDIDGSSSSAKLQIPNTRSDAVQRRSRGSSSSNGGLTGNGIEVSSSRKKTSKKVCGSGSSNSGSASSNWAGRRGSMNNKSYSSSLSKFTLQDESGKRKIRGDIMSIAESLPALPGLYFDKKQKGFRVRYQNVYVGWVALSRFPSIEEAYISARDIWENAKQHAEKFNTPHAAVMASLPLQKEAQAAGKNRGGRPRTVTQLPHTPGDWLNVYPTQASQAQSGSGSSWRAPSMYSANAEDPRARLSSDLQQARRPNRIANRFQDNVFTDYMPGNEVADVLNTPDLTEGLWSAAGYMRPEGLMGFAGDGLNLDPTSATGDPFSIYADPGPLNYMDAPGAVSYSQPVQEQLTSMEDLPELLGFDDPAAALVVRSHVSDDLSAGMSSDNRKRKARPWEEWHEVPAGGMSNSPSGQGPSPKRRNTPLESESPLNTLKNTPSTEAPSSALIKTEQ
eukprot:Gregarina_sp_Pseudo_9__5799@NODE_874_length_2113_cov_23_919961_g822_i0_p1_GENE_NODE_874_length_2113_cov_23_919961_g822_i0NODE_874_length_2113_cov_23_919961_g822_i0_p1_ORF_typecomplete_len656_score52_71gerPA/PF10676_9/2_1e02gerPA/PF10676_9/17_NODE_874_length_2113_cov_23_919961_g822_i0402007